MGTSRLLIFAYNKLRKHNVNIAPFETFIGWIFDTVKQGKVTLDGLNFEISNEATTRRFRSRFLTNAHEISERTLAKRYISPNATVLELGGGLGIVSCIVNNMLKDPKKHIVVDPDPRSLASLKRNREINNASYQLLEGVVSEQEDQAIFFTPNSISTSLLRGHETQRIPVKSLSIDAIEKENSLSFDSYIVDIEGAELTWAQENKKHLEKLSVIIMEFHPKVIGQDKCDEVRQIFAACGLECADRMHDVEAWRRPQ